MKRFFLALFVFCVIFASGAMLAGARNLGGFTLADAKHQNIGLQKPALALNDSMWFPYMGNAHSQTDIDPDTELRYDQGDYVCTRFAELHCLQVLYNAYYNLRDTPVDLFIKPVIGTGTVFHRTIPTDSFPNYNDVYFRYKDGEEIYKLPHQPTPVTPYDIMAWLPVTPVITRIVDSNCVGGQIESWEEGDSIITWNGNSGNTGVFHDVLVVDYEVVNGDTCFVFMNSYFNSQEPDEGRYFKMYIGDGSWMGQDDGHGNSCTKFLRIHENIDIYDKDFYDGKLDYSLAPRIFPQFIPTADDFTQSEMYVQGAYPKESIYINCDVAISDGETFAVPGGVNVKVAPESQGANLGGYPDKNEIIVNGGPFGGGHLNLQSNVVVASSAESPQAGDWGGIKVSNLGRLTVGDCVTIRDAMIGFNIDSGGSNIDFPAWTGTTEKKCTISNCHDWGMLISSNASDITNIEFNGNGTTDYHGSLCVMSGSSAPTISHVTISGSTVYGTYATNYSNMNLSYSKFDSSIQRHMVFLYSPSTSLSLEDKLNKFLYTGDGTYHAIWNPYGDSLKVQNNYWNGETDTNKLFEYPSWVIWTPTASSAQVANAGAFKIASPFAQSNPFLEAEQMEKSGLLSAARDIYRQIISSNNNPHDKSHAIKSLIRVYENDPALSSMRECDQVISEQISTASGWYKALIDYLQCDLIVKEASKELRGSTLSQEEKKARYRDRITEAIHQFVTKSDEYVGTDMQVEMLSRVAVLYGDYLHDKSSAKTYADKAASINPGQPILLTAYQTAGIEYDPWKYTDIYFGKEIGDQPSDNQLADSSAITIWPNPFNPSTTIAFSLNAPSRVKIAIYSINGQKIADLTNKMLGAGHHSVVFNGSKYASGVYFYRFESDGNIKSGKMLMVK